MSDGKDGKSSSKLIAVKTESGSAKATSSEKRLPSFTKRDLTLGGGSTSRAVALALTGNRGRKNYAPNLNVQRTSVKEEVKTKEESTKSKTGSRGRGRGATERSRNNRGRGRGTNLIQLSNGVFSEGIAAAAAAAAQRSSRCEDDDKPSKYIPKPSLNLKQNYSADSVEEGEMYKQILNDKFIDDPDAVTDGIKPLQLPMIPIKKRAQAPVTGGVVVKKEKEDPDFRAEPSLPEKQSVVKIKKEPVEAESQDFKPALKDDEWNLYDRRVGDLLVSREPEYILIQLPDCLPGLRPTVESENGKNSSSSVVPQESPSDITPQPQCTLSSLPEGLVGKIQLLRSGRARLQLGSVSFPISMGTQVAFRQDLISVNLNDVRKGGTMVNMGQVRTRMVMTPDWETLLRKV